MSSKVIFLSHIHEETELAILFKDALETEFAGFVDVFVSSDGVSIPAGANFLKRIENGLVNCVGAIYLISPVSVQRNWINFELGAVWIRNIIDAHASTNEIPILPLCHSGMTPGRLPLPLNNLNGVLGSEASQLDFSFRSLQSAVGGKGKLKTDFDELALRTLAFEQQYTLGDNLKALLKLLGAALDTLVAHFKILPSNVFSTVDFGFVDNDLIKTVMLYEAEGLKGHIRVKVNSVGLAFGAKGAVTGGDLQIDISAALVQQFEALLLKI